MSRLRNSLAVRFIGSVLMLVLLPTVLLGITVYAQARSDVRRSAFEQIANASAKLAERIDAFILSQREISHYAATSTEVRDYIRSPGDPEARATLTQWLKSGPFLSDIVAEVFLLDAQGTCLASTNSALIGQSYGNRPYYQKAVGGRDAVSDWSIATTSGESGVFLASPVRGTYNEVAGVLVIQLKTAPLESIIRQAAVAGTDAVVLNRAGVVLYAYDESYAYQTIDDLSAAERHQIDSTLQFADEPLPSLHLTRLREDLLQVTPGETSTSREYDFAGASRVSALTGLATQPWTLAVMSPTSEIEAAAAPVSLIIGLVIVLILVYAALATVYLGRFLIRPLRELAHSSHQLAEGTLNVQVPVRGDDEIAQLATAFNAMAMEIRGNTERLETEVARRTIELKDANQAITQLSITDDLTRCFNRRYLDQQLPREIDRAGRYGRNLSVIMCDIDLFKSINDRFGHTSGDAVLRALGAHLNTTRRQPDWVARFGGEEFVIVLPETNLEGALAIAERTRSGIEGLVITEASPSIAISASFGVGAFRRGRDDTPQTIINRCDEALYRAKAGGRNQIMAEAPADPLEQGVGQG